MRVLGSTQLRGAPADATHLSSAFLGPKAPEGQELFWQKCATDMVRIVDHLDSVEAALSGLKGCLDPARVSVAGLSAGRWTASMLLGASNTDPRDRSTWYELETRIQGRKTWARGHQWVGRGRDVG